jgi:hypothetical protein
MMSWSSRGSAKRRGGGGEGGGDDEHDWGVWLSRIALVVVREEGGGLDEVSESGVSSDLTGGQSGLKRKYIEPCGIQNDAGCVFEDDVEVEVLSSTCRAEIDASRAETVSPRDDSPPVFSSLQESILVE